MGTMILGIDAAWTEREPSGVALIESRGGRWRCIAAAPSYASFVNLAGGHPIDWAGPDSPGSKPAMRDLLGAAQSLAGAAVDVIAIDMPMSCRSIEGRRVADQRVSECYGGRGCSTHSPSKIRPGPLGQLITSQLAEGGYALAASGCTPGAFGCVIEVYPHPALLSLLGRTYRVPYKVGNTKKYWPELDLEGRLTNVRNELEAIHTKLDEWLCGLTFTVPPRAQIPTLSSLKRYEDVLDSVVCAWMGARYVEGAARPLGDHNAAIWCPLEEMTVAQ